jgi:hypothetical protein
MAVTPYAILSYTHDDSDPTTTARDCTADDQCIMLNCDDSDWYQVSSAGSYEKEIIYKS